MRQGKLQPPDNFHLNLPQQHQRDLFATSSDELATPPYRQHVSSSHLPLTGDYPPSPAYASRSRVDVADTDDDDDDKKTASNNNMDSKHNHHDDYSDEKQPKVHYPDETLNDPPVPGYHTRNDSTDMLGHSRASSMTGTDEEYEEEEDYDWSGEEDLVDEEAKFEQRMGIKQKRKGWGFKRIVTLLFSSLLGSTFLAGIMVTPGILIHFYWYKLHPTEHRLFVKQNVQSWTFWAAANLLISWYLAMIVDVIPIIFTFIISAAWGHVSERIKSRVELYDSVKNTIKPLLYAGCAWASWVIVFENIYKLYDPDKGTESDAPYLDRIVQVVEFFFFFTLVVCVQKMLSHAIAFAFHATAFKERIAEIQTALTAIEKLRDYKPKIKSGARTPIFGGGLTPFSEKEHFNFLSGALRAATPDHGHRDHGEDADTEDDHQVKQKGEKKKKTKKDKGKAKYKSPRSSVALANAYTDSPSSDHAAGSSAFNSPMSGPGSRPMTPSGLHATTNSDSPHRYPPSRNDSPNGDADATLVQAAKVLKSAVLHDARNIKGKNEGIGGMAWNVNSAQEAKRLARSIYMRFRDRRRNYLLPSDFYPAFSDDIPAATAAFRVFDKDNNGDLSRAEVKTTLLKVYKERRFLSRSMRDVSVALRTLDHILLFFALVILFFISLSVFRVEVGDSLTSVYSIGIAASFIFKNAASQAFDAIMFLFVTHPYDTGDRCFIDDEVLVVKKMTLFATVFTRADGTETYYFNSQLFNKFITNIRRSGKQFENLEMQVAWRTPTEKLDRLEKMMNEWLATEENRWFEPSTSVTFQHIDFQRHLRLTVGIGHNGNWQDWGLRLARKTAFHAAVNFYCRQLGIKAYEAPIPVVWGNDPSAINQVQDAVVPGDDEEPDTAKRPELPELDTTDVTGMKPVLGFMPPLADRKTMLRARKSKGRKAMMRGVGGGD